MRSGPTITPWEAKVLDGYPGRQAAAQRVVEKPVGDWNMWVANLS